MGERKDVDIMRDALEWYEETYCVGWCKTHDSTTAQPRECQGCVARIALGLVLSAPPEQENG